MTSYLLVYKESLPKCMDMGTCPWVSDIFAMEKETRRERERERERDRQTDKKTNKQTDNWKAFQKASTLQGKNLLIREILLELIPIEKSVSEGLSF